MVDNFLMIQHLLLLIILKKWKKNKKNNWNFQYPNLYLHVENVVYIIHNCAMNNFLILLTAIAFHFPSVPSFLLPASCLSLILHPSFCFSSLSVKSLISPDVSFVLTHTLAQNFLIQPFWLRHTLSRSTLPAAVVHNGDSHFEII